MLERWRRHRTWRAWRHEVIGLLLMITDVSWQEAKRHVAEYRDYFELGMTPFEAILADSRYWLG